MSKLKYIILSLFSMIAYSQTSEEILKKTTSAFEQNKTMSVKSKYQLYKTHTSTTVVEFYNALFMKKDKAIYQKIGETEFVQNNNKSLKIVNKDKKLYYFSHAVTLNQNVFDVKQLEQAYKIKSLVDKKSYWEITLDAKKYSSVEFGRIVLWINKNYTLKKQIFYYSLSVNFSKKMNKQDIDTPRLEVDYEEVIQNKPITNSFFDLNNYVTVSNNSVLPKGKYAKYKLIVQK